MPHTVKNVPIQANTILCHTIVIHLKLTISGKIANFVTTLGDRGKVNTIREQHYSVILAH